MSGLKSSIGRAVVVAVTGATLGLAVASPSHEAGAASSDVTCDIRVRDGAGGVVLEGVVRSGVPVSGSYSLVVTTSGGGGSSDIRQSGEFDAAGGATPLGMVTVSGGGRYTARLEVRWPRGSTSCTRRASGWL